MIGDLLYELEANWTIVSYGDTPLGSRNDFHLIGVVSGKISGKFTGVDYGVGANDKSISVHVHEQIITDDGENISLFRQGFAVPNAKGTYDIKCFATFSTGSMKYAWLNTMIAALEGEGSGNAPNLRLKAYEWKTK